MRGPGKKIRKTNRENYQSVSLPVSYLYLSNVFRLFLLLVFFFLYFFHNFCSLFLINFIFTVISLAHSISNRIKSNILSICCQTICKSYRLSKLNDKLCYISTIIHFLSIEIMKLVIFIINYFYRDVSIFLKTLWLWFYPFNYPHPMLVLHPYF